MKNFRILLLIFFLSGSINLSAQYALDYFKGIIRVYPVDLVFGSGSIGYEDILSDRNSLEYILSYQYFDIIVLDKDAHDFKRTMPVDGIAARINFRFYFKTNNIRDKQFYIAPQVMSRFSKGKTIRVDHFSDGRRILQINNFTGGFLIKGGVQKFSNLYFNIVEFYAGLGLEYNNYIYNELRNQEYIPLGNRIVQYKDVPSRGKYQTHAHGPFSTAINIGISLGFPHK